MPHIERQWTSVELLRRGVRGLPSLWACQRQFRNWRTISRIYSGLSPLDEPFVAEARNGCRLTVWEPADVQTLWTVFCAGAYGARRMEGLVLDLGANIGAFTVFAARNLGAQRVIALEPVGATYGKLQHNIAGNNLCSRVTTLAQGIGGADGRRCIWLGRASPYASLYFRNNPRFESGETESIDVITLDRLFEEQDVKQVELCKMDCEGAEVEALLAASDATLGKIRNLCMEYHYPPDEPGSTKAMFERLFDAGFCCAHHNQRDRLAHFARADSRGGRS